MSTTFEDYKQYCRDIASSSDIVGANYVKEIYHTKEPSDSCLLQDITIDNNVIELLTIEDTKLGTVCKMIYEITDESYTIANSSKLILYISLVSTLGMYARVVQVGNRGATIHGHFKCLRDEVVLYDKEWNISYTGDSAWLESSSFGSANSLFGFLGYEPSIDSLEITFNNQTGMVSGYIDTTMIIPQDFNKGTTFENMLNYDGTDRSALFVGTDREYPPSKYRNRSYYFYNKTFKTDGTLVRSIKGEYEGTGRICGYINNRKPYNIVLITKGDLLERINDEINWHTPTLPRLTSNDTIDNYYGLLDTNIPIFNNSSDASDYLETGNTDNAINDVDSEKDSKTGMDGTVARFERANTYDPQIYAGHTVKNVTNTHNKIVAWMNSLNNPDLFDSVKMFWWNDNPINCLLSYYWTPLDIEEVGRVATWDVEGIVKFGGIIAKDVTTEDVISCPTLCIQGGEHLLGQYQFNRKYNDWRDYQLFNYKLFLPFHGLVDLEPHYIVGKRMEVKYVYYPTNHTLRYMIFVKQNLYKAIDVSIGIDLGLTSADNVGKAQEITETAFNTLERVATGNVGGAISGVISSGLDLFKKPKTSVWGSTNPTTNIGDPTQALLYIEEQQTIIPNNLYNTYGHANYYIGNIGALSGYCEFSDVRLTGCGTLSDNEKEELKSLLMKGVIL